MPIVKVIEEIAKVYVKDGQVSTYDVVCKISFRLDADRAEK